MPPLDPQSSDDAAFLARYESLLPKDKHTTRGFGEGLPPTATVASGYLAEGGPDERARWAECYTQYHRFMKQNTGLLHECMENCWQYVQKGDLRLCRHLFNCLTRLRMPLVTVAVTLRTPEEKRALLFPGEFPAMSKNNPNGFALNMDLAVERCHYKVLKQRKWQLRPRMFLAKVGGELVEPVGEEETYHDWHARAVAQLNRVVDATAEVTLEFFSPESFSTFVAPGKRLVAHSGQIDTGPCGNVEPVRVHNMPEMVNPDAGRVLPEQTHPFEGKTHPLSLNGIQSNFDMQCFDRVMDIPGVRALPQDEQQAALRDLILIGQHKVQLSVFYSCAYAMKKLKAHGNPLESAGVSLADLDKRLQAAEEEAGKRLSDRIRGQKRLQRALSGHSKVFTQSLMMAMWPYVGSDYTGQKPDSGPGAGGPRETRLASHRFWQVQLQLAQHCLHKAYDELTGAPATAAAAADAGGGDETIKIDAAELLAKAAERGGGHSLAAAAEDVSSANQLRTFAQRGKAHPFVEAMSLYTYSEFVGHSTAFDADTVYRRPRQYARLSPEHPDFAGEKARMLSIRTMAPPLGHTSSYSDKAGSRAARIPYCTGWNPIGCTSKDPSVRENDAAVKLLLFTPALHTPLRRDCECSRTLGSVRMGDCLCLWTSLCTEKDSSGVLSWTASLKAAVAGWKRDRRAVDEWERRLRRWPATPGALWDWKWDTCRCDYCLRPARDEKGFLEHHRVELYTLMHSLSARTAVEVLERIECWAFSFNPKYAQNAALTRKLREEGGNEGLLRSLLQEQDLVDDSAGPGGLVEGGTGEVTTEKEPGKGGGPELGEAGGAEGGEQKGRVDTSAGRLTPGELDAIRRGAPLGCRDMEQYDKLVGFKDTQQLFAGSIRRADGTTRPCEGRPRAAVACRDPEEVRELLGGADADSGDGFLEDEAEDDDAHALAHKLAKKQADRLAALKKGADPDEDGGGDPVLEAQVRRIVQGRLRDGLPPRAVDFAGLPDGGDDAMRDFIRATGKGPPLETPAALETRVGHIRAWVYTVMFHVANSPEAPFNHYQYEAMLLATPVLARLLADALERGGKQAVPRYGKPTELAFGAAHVHGPMPPPKKWADLVDSFRHSPSGAAVDWKNLPPSIAQQLLEKPSRAVLVGEGGNGKTYVVNRTIGLAFRTFLAGFSNFHPLAYTNRAAAQLGTGADTMSGYGELRPQAGGGARGGRKSGGRREACTDYAGSCVVGGTGKPQQEQRLKNKFCETGAGFLDEISQPDTPDFDELNEKVWKGRRAFDEITELHYELPFAMMALFWLGGDFAQLTMPYHTIMARWPRLFGCLRVPKHSPKEMAKLITGKKQRSGDDSLYTERAKVANGLNPGDRLPAYYPKRDSDPSSPPAVTAMEMLTRRDPQGRRVYPIDKDLGSRFRGGFEAYIRFQDVVLLPENQRFKDDDGDPLVAADGAPLGLRALKTVNPYAPLPSLLRLMREGRLVTHGEPIPDKLFNEVFGPARTTPQALDVPGSFPTQDTFHVALQWDFLRGVMLSTTRAKAEDAGKMLFYTVARDTESSGTTLSPNERSCLRHHGNPNNTGSRTGVLPLFEGLEMELTEKVCAKAGALKATSGVVERIIPDPQEPMGYAEEGSAERQRGYVVLKHVPTVLLRVEGFTEGVIPGRPDLLIVAPTKSRPFTWKWETCKDVHTSATRFGLALLPLGVASPFTAQGMTADWLLGHGHRGRGTKQDQWYQLYVLASRARHHSRFAHHGPVPPEMPQLLAQGPGPVVLAEIARLKALALATRPKTRASARVMGMPAPGRELAEWRRANGVREPAGAAEAYEKGDLQPMPPPGGRSDEAVDPATLCPGDFEVKGCPQCEKEKCECGKPKRFVPKRKRAEAEAAASGAPAGAQPVAAAAATPAPPTPLEERVKGMLLLSWKQACRRCPELQDAARCRPRSVRMWRDYWGEGMSKAMRDGLVKTMQLAASSPPAPLEEKVEGMLRLPWEEARGLFPDLERVTEMKPDGARAWCVFWGPTMRKNFRSGLVVALREAAVSAGLAAAPAAAVPGAALVAAPTVSCYSARQLKG